MPALAHLADVVAALHFDLAEWMSSNAPPKVFDRFANALDDKFSAVTTVGQVIDRDTLLAGVWSAKNSQPGLRIEVSDLEELAHSGKLVTVRFVAENCLAEVRTRRLVTAILLVADHGYLWRSVHETAVAKTE
ncbi:hypothetical protein F5X71_07140 [Nocardia brasiliensis]|uniref:DUF4440 domain-containing protein n=1 Tax=Nocardia brasiliensis TaxID=37326 RepID=A0A6G9XMF2_NOCBR|nr:hypothetical protein [Nocardia brasiliensis]QIS02122.1 hypothetical protein F5X71_07140 [Nocardia brasiliensis]